MTLAGVPMIGLTVLQGAPSPASVHSAVDGSCVSALRSRQSVTAAAASCLVVNTGARSTTVDDDR